MDRETFALKLKEGRIASGLTQKDVSDILKRPQQTIGAWEVGRSQPDMDTLSKLLQLYRISANDFFEFDEELDFKVTLEEKAHIKKYRVLDQYGKNAVEAILNCENERCIQTMQNVVVEDEDTEQELSDEERQKQLAQFLKDRREGKTRFTSYAAYGGNGVEGKATTKEDSDALSDAVKKIKAARQHKNTGEDES